MALALVTGATGLVGSHIVERLLADGWKVRALTRDPSRAGWLSEKGVECRVGDILDASSLQNASPGCDAIFHAAAVITPRGGWEVFRAANVEGTRNALRAAEKSGARLLQLSSVAVYGSAARFSSRPTDESLPLSLLPEAAYYARSKREAEDMVLEAHARGAIWATAVRPDVIYGRRDRQFVPRVARILRHGVVPMVGSGHTTLAIVHAANVADGAVRAVACDKAGGRAYNLANDFDVSVAEFIRLAGLGLGRRIRLLHVPLAMAQAGMKALRLAVRLTLGKAIAEQAGGTLDFLTRDNPFTSERARRDLGWTPLVTPDVGVVEAFRWFRNRNE